MLGIRARQGFRNHNFIYTINHMAEHNSTEIREWLDALESLVKFEDRERAGYIIERLVARAAQLGVDVPDSLNSPYINTIPAAKEAAFPEDLALYKKITRAIRWNAMVMVTRANMKDSSLGGHIATYGSSADLFEIGLNYFFHAPSADHPGDLIFFQGHSSPGIYARAFLEGRLNEKNLNAFRQELSDKNGIASYPHPWLMPNFWQFPTVSMGIGPLNAIFQAHYLRYLHNRELKDTSKQKVWAFCGDGEMGEPDSMGLLNIASREKLDNLIFVISCNLQRLDGPVWGNGQVIQEFERIFKGAGWNVIKVIWGGGWDALFEKDSSGILMKRIGELLDGEYQTYTVKGPAFLREKFFGKYPELAELVKDYSDEDLRKLNDGGHDPQKVYAAYKAAIEHKGQPTVILAKTIKGFGMGEAGRGSNVTHNVKKMKAVYLKTTRDRFELPLSDEQVENLEYYVPAKDSPEMQHMQNQRKKLGGYLPARHADCEKLKTPDLKLFDSMLQDSGDREISTTMAFVRVLSLLLRDENIKERVIPIVADESRTFGMEGLFRQIGIYSAIGQLYEPEDRTQLMYYREDQKGQLLQEGLSEAGAMSSWMACASSYMTTHVPVIPFYIYYSMFGYQRVGDFIWAAADMRARGFIMGATAGRTTLNGEGLQHQDGHNLIMFGMVPTCKSYDPTYAYEMAVIIQHGIERMFKNQIDEFYYITCMNENYHHPAMPKGVEAGIIKGLYLFKQQQDAAVQLLGSGTILNEVRKAAAILADDFNIKANVWSATSFNELRKEWESTERHNRLHLEKKKSYIETCLATHTGPVIAATDYMRLYAEQIRNAVPNPYYVLGTDGFGRSDTRAALRDFFEVDAKMIVYTTLYALYEQGEFTAANLEKAKKSLQINLDRPDPWTV